MIIIDDILVSEDVYKEEFVCNLSKCKGACCVEGDFGAPLEKEEIVTLKGDLNRVLPYLTEEGRAHVKKGGFFHWIEDISQEGTQLLPDGACVFTVKDDNGVAACGIERAHEKGHSQLQKPISCHLYPIRVKKIEEVGFEALNYDRWSICSPACSLGKELQVPVYRFVRHALIRKYGKDFFDQLDEAVRHISG